MFTIIGLTTFFAFIGIITVGIFAFVGFIVTINAALDTTGEG